MTKKITIQLDDDDHKRFVNAKMDLQLRSLQDLMIQGTNFLLETIMERRTVNLRYGLKELGIVLTGDNNLDATPTKSINSDATGQPPPDLTPLENLCIERLLRILRSPKPGLPDAIISNLMQFEDASAMYERIGHSDQEVASPSAPSEEKRTRDVDQQIADLERSARGITERIQRVKADGDAARKRQAGHPGKARKRSGA